MTPPDPPGTGPVDDPGHGPSTGDDVTAGEDPVAVLQTTLRVQQIGLNRLADQVRTLTTLLQDRATTGPDGPPAHPDDATGTAPWCWRGIAPDRAAGLWAELADWVEWLHTRYPLAEVLPGCWWRHPEVVEELTAAHEAWKFANTSPGANPYGPAEWHAGLDGDGASQESASGLSRSSPTRGTATRPCWHLRVPGPDARP
jgi:hypothetical protein